MCIKQNGAPYRHCVPPRSQFELGQQPDVVDELGRHVHEVLRVDGPSRNGEDVVCIQLGLGLVACQRHIGDRTLELVSGGDLLPSGKKYLAIYGRREL